MTAKPEKKSKRKYIPALDLHKKWLKDDPAYRKAYDESEPTLRPVRNDALNKLAKVMTAEWGNRCDRFETGCATCMAWAVFDLVEKVTDGSALDDPDEYKRVHEHEGKPS